MVSFPLVYEKDFVKQNSSIIEDCEDGVVCVGQYGTPLDEFRANILNLAKKKKKELVLVIKIYFSWQLESLLINTRKHFFHCSKQESAHP